MKQNLYFIKENDSANLTPAKILEGISKLLLDSNEYAYIVLGRVGPTGKTWLCDQLHKLGYSAFEISEDIWGLVSYINDENHVRIDEYRKVCVIVLNTPIKESRA